MACLLGVSHLLESPFFIAQAMGRGSHVLMDNSCLSKEGVRQWITSLTWQLPGSLPV